MSDPKIDPEDYGVYHKATEKIVQTKKIHCQAHHQTFQNMSLYQLVVLGANTKTLVWEYLSAHMNYDNEIQPEIIKMSHELGINRVNASQAIRLLHEKNFIACVEGKAKGRRSRKWMINPNFRNRGSSKEVHNKRKRWEELTSPVVSYETQADNKTIEEHHPLSTEIEPAPQVNDTENSADDEMPF